MFLGLLNTSISLNISYVTPRLWSMTAMRLFKKKKIDLRIKSHLYPIVISLLCFKGHLAAFGWILWSLNLDILKVVSDTVFAE